MKGFTYRKAKQKPALSSKQVKKKVTVSYTKSVMKCV